MLHKQLLRVGRRKCGYIVSQKFPECNFVSRHVATTLTQAPTVRETLSLHLSEFPARRRIACFTTVMRRCVARRTAGDVVPATQFGELSAPVAWCKRPRIVVAYDPQKIRIAPRLKVT